MCLEAAGESVSIWGPDTHVGSWTGFQASHFSLAHSLINYFQILGMTQFCVEYIFELVQTPMQEGMKRKYGFCTNV